MSPLDDTVAPSSSVLDLGVDEKLQPRSKSHFYFSLRSDHKRLHDPCKEEGARGFMTHWLHTGHYWLFRGDQGESTLGTERYMGMLRNCYYRASLHIVPCSRKSRPHTLWHFMGTSFFIQARFAPATAFACSNVRGRIFLIRATPPERAAKVTFYSLDREVVRSLWPL
jgi:hypothetical protein